MRILAIIDLETTTADPATARIVETACCLWSVDHRAVINTVSMLVQGTENAARDINHIPDALLPMGSPIDRALTFIGHFVAKADVIAAHFGETFDRPVLEAHACPWVASKPWLDTNDIEYPRQSGRSLLAIAHVHGVQIGTLHRATDDVLLVARLLERLGELGADVPALIARAMRPKVRVIVADTSFSEERNAQAKTAGFTFDRATNRALVLPRNLLGMATMWPLWSTCCAIWQRVGTGRLHPSSLG
jgi:DNA polymerase III epsilon subunit-like protein